MPNPVDDLSEEQLEALPEGLRGEVRKNQQYRQEAEAANARVAAAERETAFAKAGLPDTPLVAELAKNYEGENDPESIKAHFEKLGVNLAQDDGASDADLNPERQVAQLGSQGEAGADMRFEDAINSAKNVDEVMALIASAPPGATGWIDGRERQVQPPRID